MTGDSFTFPSLQAAKPLPLQNPLLSKATVVDRSKAPSGVSGSGGEAMGSAQSTPASAPQPAASRAPATRKKVPYEKGYSQMDWVRLTQRSADMSGRGGGRPRTDISMEEVARHKTPEDGWTVLHGKVYNLTPYLKFHPGGEAILKVALGKDCTALFNRYHAWVNSDFLLAKCLVGTLAAGPQAGGSTRAAAASSGGAAGTAASSGVAAQPSEAPTSSEQPAGGEAPGGAA